ncbi:hypothetical protein CDD83_835 [Cordyceps sp. RAO-2017]|nr:hypothetical protein CDD83_835 [Cordyceps sp. RAO-2017]
MTAVGADPSTDVMPESPARAPFNISPSHGRRPVFSVSPVRPPNGRPSVASRPVSALDVAASHSLPARRATAFTGQPARLSCLGACWSRRARTVTRRTHRLRRPPTAANDNAGGQSMPAFMQHPLVSTACQSDPHEPWCACLSHHAFCHSNRLPGSGKQLTDDASRLLRQGSDKQPSQDVRRGSSPLDTHHITSARPMPSRPTHLNLRGPFGRLLDFDPPCSKLTTATIVSLLQRRGSGTAALPEESLPLSSPTCLARSFMISSSVSLIRAPR